MVVTTAVFVARAVLLTDGNLAAFSHLPRRFAGGAHGLSDSNVKFYANLLSAILINTTLEGNSSGGEGAL